MITSIASCPNPPLLLPGATGNPLAEVEKLRQACIEAVAALLNRGASLLVVVGAAQQQDEPNGVLSIQVGHSLLDQLGMPPGLEVIDEVLPADLPSQECIELGRRLAADDRSTALLVMADGSARRSVKAPGHLDERAVPFDTEIERALLSGRGERLTSLDPQLATELLVAGRSAWQVMGAAAEATVPSEVAAATNAWVVQSYYDGAPFGVFYPVVTWLTA